MVNQFNRPRNLQSVLKAGSKDPRTLLQNVRGYDPSIQADQVQTYNENAAQYQPNAMLPLSQAVTDANQSIASSQRLRVEYTPFVFVGTLQPSGIILIPRNTSRANFYVINLSVNGSDIRMSFGPSPMQTVPGSTSIVPLGFDIDALVGEFFTEQNGCVGINDIWIYPSGGVAISAIVLGYEAIAAIGSQS